MTIEDLAKEYPDRYKTSDTELTVHNLYGRDIRIYADGDKLVMTGHEGLTIHVEAELFGITSIRPIGGPLIRKGDVILNKKVKAIVKYNKSTIHLHI